MDNDTTKSETEDLSSRINDLKKSIEEEEEYKRFVMENLECAGGYYITKITELKDMIAQKRLKNDLADKEAEELKYYEALFRLTEKQIAFCEKLSKDHEEIDTLYEEGKKEHDRMSDKIRETVSAIYKKFPKLINDQEKYFQI